MSTPANNAALICIDVPGISVAVVLRGTDVPAGQPSQADALDLLERVLQHARQQLAATGQDCQ